MISGRGRNARYFIGNRLLEKEELKLIIDSVNASNFIEKSIATKMVDKLRATMSKYDAEELDRSVLGINIAKAENKKILYNVKGAVFCCDSPFSLAINIFFYSSFHLAYAQ